MMGGHAIAQSPEVKPLVWRGESFHITRIHWNCPYTQKNGTFEQQMAKFVETIVHFDFLTGIRFSMWERDSESESKQKNLTADSWYKVKDQRISSLTWGPPHGKRGPPQGKSSWLPTAQDAPGRDHTWDYLPSFVWFTTCNQVVNID